MQRFLFLSSALEAFFESLGVCPANHDPDIRTASASAATLPTSILCYPGASKASNPAHSTTGKPPLTNLNRKENTCPCKQRSFTCFRCDMTEMVSS